MWQVRMDCPIVSISFPPLGYAPATNPLPGLSPTPPATTTPGGTRPRSGSPGGRGPITHGGDWSEWLKWWQWWRRRTHS
jgi:hypothetical protein